MRRARERPRRRASPLRASWRSRRSRRRPAAIARSTEAAGPRRGCTCARAVARARRGRERRGRGRACARSWRGRGRSRQATAIPRVEVEVLRADETSEGIAAGAGGPVSRAHRRRPRRRGVDRPGAPARRPRATRATCAPSETVAVDESSAGPDPRASAFHEADALRAAARRLGRTLGGRVTRLARCRRATTASLDESRAIVPPAAMSMP